MLVWENHCDECAHRQNESETVMKMIQWIESEDLILRLFDNGCFGIVIKKVSSEWGPDLWESIAGQVTARIDERDVTFILGGEGHAQWRCNGNTAEVQLGSKDSGAVRLTAALTLNGPVLNLSLRALDLPENAWLLNVEYPLRQFGLLTNTDNGYLALTCGEGTLIPTHHVKLGACEFWAWEDMQHGPGAQQVDGNPAMPFYGAQRDDAGYVAIVETDDDFAFHYIMNNQCEHRFDVHGLQSPFPQIASAHPIWLSQKGEFGYERRMRFEFAPRMDYVAMAKTYRREAIARGHFVSLAEKRKARPQVAQLAGAPYIAYYAGYPHREPGYSCFKDYTYKQLQNVVDDLAGPMGLERAFVHFWGAYAALPPSCLPFDTKPGTVEDLKAVVEKCKQYNYLFTLYNDISAQLEETDRWYPELQWKMPDGKPRPGYRWSRTCSSQYVDLLSKDMPEVVKTLGVNACYVDCINAGRATECYDPKHPLTRSQDREARSAFYEYVHSLGLIFGGEHTGWWNAAHLEYTNGVGIAAGTPFMLRAFPVPLAHLVFHDAMVLFCHAADDYSRSNGTAFEDKVLRDLLRCVPPMYFINLRDHGMWRRKIIDSYNVISKPAAATLHDEMLSHEFMTDDQKVQRTTFASGLEITANFDETEREGLQGKGYQVKGLPGGWRTGHFAGRWVKED